MIYLLSRPGHIDYDEYDSKVVRATSEREARALANAQVGDEGNIWEDSSEVNCEVVDPEGQPGVISSSFHVG